MGSSSKTFFSMLSYIKDHRPKVVILENVLGAPWGETRDVWFPFLGYTAYHIKLDTKDFYIPQTRMRGYLIAMDNEVFAKGRTYLKKEPKKEDDSKKKALSAAEKQAREEEELRWDAGQIGLLWLFNLTEVLRRRASSEVQFWTFPSAHPLTERARQDDSEKSGSGSNTNWAHAKMLHIRTRKIEMLGEACLLTNWRNPHAYPYDRMDRNILYFIPDRVKDCMEINLLRALEKGYNVEGTFYTYDSRFKSRIYDLSQNIHRSKTGSPFGITGCLTPSGIHFMSDQCRMVSGFEMLALQGLPLYRIEFAVETQEQLRDLAGNAMSTTVVGAVLLALFMAVFEQPGGPQKYFDRAPFPLVKPKPRLIADFELKDIADFSTTSAQPINTSAIKELYARTRRYCFCNGAAKYSTDDFVECERCLTIRCKWCAGNPEHCFKPTKRPGNYLLLSEVEQEVMRFFPGTITGLISEKWLESTTPNQDVTIANIPAALEALRDATFYYKSVKITEVVTICYSGQSGFFVQATLSEAGVTWYLYLDPWSDFGGKLGKLLKPELAAKIRQSLQPIAKAELFDSTDQVLPESHHWKLWHFFNIPLSVSVSRNEDILVIRSIQGTPGGYEEYLGLEDACGSYHHCRTCDAPEQSLHAQQKKVFLYKDASRTLTPDLDGYVISKSCRQLEFHEYREVLVKFDPKINMKTLQSGSVAAYLDGYWREPSSRADKSPGLEKLDIFKRMEKLKVLDSQHSLIENEESEQRVLAEVRIVREVECDTYRTIKKYEAQCNKGSDGWAVVTKADLQTFHKFISHANIKLAGVEDLETELKFTDIEACLLNFKAWRDGIAAANPRECLYGQLPPVRWIKCGSRYIGHHLTDAMADFEKKLKSRIPIFELRVKVLQSPDESGKMHAIHVQYLFQHKVLGQKAAILLPPSRDPTAKLTAGVRVERNVVLSQNIQVASNDNDRHKFQPFRKGLFSLEGHHSAVETLLKDFRTDLTDSQLRSLAWILDRERSGVRFLEREIDEDVLSELMLRLVGWAKRIVTSYGGVLADDVGYGKTVTMLAAVHCQQEFDSQESFEERRRIDKSPCKYLKATLVIVPHHLLDQWANEAARFLPKKTPIVKIQSISDLRDNSSWSVLKRLEKATIIVVSHKLFDKSYHEKLAGLSGSLDPPELSINKSSGDCSPSRSFEEWYEEAAPAARAHASALLDFSTTDAQLDDNRIQQIWDTIKERTERLSREYKLYAENLDHSWTKRPVLRKKRGKGNGDGEIEQINDRVSHRINSLEELKEICQDNYFHMLESFTFSRAVYDEFSYEKFPAKVFFANCSAHAKWILSATPPTDNLGAVHGIAKLINIHIARPIFSRVGMPKITKGPEFGEQTNAEALQNRKLMSDMCIRERHEKGMEFIKTFATSNTLDLIPANDIKVEEKVIVCEMNKHETIQYMTLEHDLRACSLDANMLSEGCRAIYQDLIDLREWSEDGKNVGMKMLLGQSSCGSDNGSFESLKQERNDQLDRAKHVFGALYEKAIWLAKRIRTNEEEIKLLNAKTATDDVMMIARDIWCQDIKSCGGRDAWGHFFKALGVDGQKAEEPKTQDSEFYKDGPELLDFLYGLRKFTWSDFFDIKKEQLQEIGEEEAGKLLADLQETPTNGSNKDKLKEIICGAQGLARYRRLDLGTLKRPIRNQKPLPAKYTKADLCGILRSVGAIAVTSRSLGDLKKQYDDHYAGELDDSKYVGSECLKAIKRTNFPTFGNPKKIRGGKYTATGSEITDTSVGLRAAFVQLDLAIKQQRIVKNLTCTEGQKMYCDGCGQQKSREELFLVCECGHVLCNEHIGSKCCGDSSGTEGCVSLLDNATKRLALIDRPERIHGDGYPEGSSVDGMSSKMKMIVNYIKGIPEDDKAILFFQFDRQKKELIWALQKNHISYTDSPSTNLQYANHVLFACPLLESLQENYDKHMKQAKGRCIRFGQKKVVHVCHFVTAQTVEADILELRRESQIVVRPKEACGKLRYVPRTQSVAANNGVGISRINNKESVADEQEEKVRSMLTSNEIWKAMSESNWLNTVGIEY
ncbi:SNF2 family N-terminal domain-containing protein [Rostrohypoxylon terebratum]|nr:SNF2 family N-terminal domain-containing protein [Rostrohypoxylon terebratum]